MKLIEPSAVNLPTGVFQRGLHIESASDNFSQRIIPETD